MKYESSPNAAIQLPAPGNELNESSEIRTRPVFAPDNDNHISFPLADSATTNVAISQEDSGVHITKTIHLGLLESMVIDKLEVRSELETKITGNLTRRKQLVAVLRTIILAEGTPLKATQLFNTAWRGEAAHPKSAVNRVRVAIATLRDLGLRPAIETHDQGYRLKEHVSWEVAGDSLIINI